ncbi:MAG: Cys-tRNA(Pro) deacylase [Rikenellaceae bacterium]
MTKKITKTNAVRLLSQAKIAYRLLSYEVDENNLAATHVAEQLNENIAQVFKTLVLKGDKTGNIVCVIPGDQELDLKLAAKVSVNKSVNMIPMKELLSTTGYIRGACSPIGMKRTLPTYIHSSALEFDAIYVSAGVRGVQIEINPRELIDFVKANIVDIIEK